jgi:hypothetical protein
MSARPMSIWRGHGGIGEVASRQHQQPLAAQEPECAQLAARNASRGKRVRAEPVAKKYGAPDAPSTCISSSSFMRR